MILYLDASGLVKRYVSERGTTEVAQAISSAELVGTSIVTRAEVAAALAKSVRVGVLSGEDGRVARADFQRDWPALVRIQITESVVARAYDLAWELGLRGYDAVQLACASVWKENMQADVVLATFDLQLWEAARQRDFTPFPEDLAPFLTSEA